MDRDAEPRKILKKTYASFFDRFGSLRPIQTLVIPRLLSEKDLVVVSPTASGKTEAILAPLSEKLLEKNEAKGIAILWIAPTRALVNDLFQRFRGPLDLLGIKYERKTGDHPTLPTRKIPPVIITTPESLDSMLCRYPHHFTSLMASVLDDLHLLDSSPRGEHLQILISRLRLLAKEPFQTIAASATIPEPVKIGQKYLSDFEVAISSQERPFEFFLIKKEKTTPEFLIEDFKERGFKKILVFANSRLEAERLAKVFNRVPFLERSFVHHGSLSRRERESVEKWMNTTKTGVLVATTTLELGIDIGDIDAVILYEPPFDLQSFLQRIGRGNRRREKAVGYGVFSDPWECLVFDVYLEEAASGNIGCSGESVYISVGVQQVLSYLYQRRRIGCTYRKFFEVLGHLMDEETLLTILNHLEDQGFIERLLKGIYAPTERLLNAGERGFLHSNIERRFWEVRIVEAGSGKEIGNVQLLSPQFELGGNLWEVVHAEKRTAWVRPIRAILRGAGRIFRGKGMFWDFRLGERIKAKLFSDVPMGQIPFLKLEEGILLFHFSGPLQGFLWERALKGRGLSVEDLSGKVMVIRGTKTKPEDLRTDHQELRLAIEESMGVLNRFLSLGAFFSYLPPHLQLDAVEKTLDLSGSIERWNRAAFIEVSPDTALPVMEIIGS
jgi:ATP-dependent Lhr-like helicase